MNKLKESKRIKCDFKHQIFSYKKFDLGDVFSECAFNRSDFVNAVVANKNFLRCDFSNSDMACAEFINCLFERCVFKSTNFSNAKFYGCIFEGDKNTITNGQINHDNYHEHDSSFERAGMNNTYYGPSEDKNTEINGVFFKNVGLRDSVFRKVKMNSSITHSVSFENVVFDTCEIDLLDLRHCACSMLNLKNTDIDLLIATEGKLFNIIGIEKYIQQRKLRLVVTQKKYENAVQDEVAMYNLCASAAEGFLRNAQLFHLINSYFILNASAPKYMIKCNLLSEIDSRKKQLIALGYDLTEIDMLIISTLDFSYRRQVETKSYLTIETLLNVVKLLIFHSIRDRRVVEKTLALAHLVQNSYANKYASISMLSQLEYYLKVIASDTPIDSYVLLINNINANFSSISDHNEFYKYVNLMMSIVDDKEYQILSFHRGSIASKIKFFNSIDTKKILIVLLFFSIDVKVEMKGFSFRLNSIEAASELISEIPEILDNLLEVERIISGYKEEELSWLSRYSKENVVAVHLSQSKLVDNVNSPKINYQFNNLDTEKLIFTKL